MFKVLVSKACRARLALYVTACVSVAVLAERMVAEHSVAVAA